MDPGGVKPNPTLQEKSDPGPDLTKFRLNKIHPQLFFFLKKMNILSGLSDPTFKKKRN